MKTKYFLLAVVAAGTIATGFGQSSGATVAEAPKAASPSTQANFGTSPVALTDRQIAEISQFQSETVTRILGINMKINGSIPQAFRVKRPLQLISPFAPAEYGSGWENVTTDPTTGQATGLKFLGVKF